MYFLTYDYKLLHLWHSEKRCVLSDLWKKKSVYFLTYEGWQVYVEEWNDTNLYFLTSGSTYIFVLLTYEGWQEYVEGWDDEKDEYRLTQSHQVCTVLTLQIFSW